MHETAQRLHREHPWRFEMLAAWQPNASFNNSVKVTLEQNFALFISTRDLPQYSSMLYIQTRYLNFQILYGRLSCWYLSQSLQNH